VSAKRRMGDLGRDLSDVTKGFCPEGDCRTYPEGITGLSLGFNPRY
jgi:hypothetical protein